VNALKANPCSLNLVPPAKKHKPRTYAYRSSRLSLCYGTREAEKNDLPTLQMRRGSRSVTMFRRRSDGWIAKR